MWCCLLVSDTHTKCLCHAVAGAAPKARRCPLAGCFGLLSFPPCRGGPVVLLTLSVSLALLLCACGAGVPAACSLALGITACAAGSCKFIAMKKMKYGGLSCRAFKVQTPADIFLSQCTKNGRPQTVMRGKAVMIPEQMTKYKP